MAKEFILTVDVTMSGDVYIEAESLEEAVAKFQEKYFVASDLRNFHEISKEVIEAQEE